jgi:UDP-N-acetylglucosamine 2-epimerase
LTFTVLTIVGARPQFIKAAALCHALEGAVDDNGVPAFVSRLAHTGQHYDVEMTGVFFDELSLPRPDHFLGVGSGSHGEQTGLMLARLETVIEGESPDLVLVVGDTNSTLAGALAAAKLRVPVAHVEAGLRSGRRDMPEEVNRVVADHLASLLFCPSASAVENLRAEGITEGVHRVGDVMLDVLLASLPSAREREAVLSDFGLKERGFVLVTIHRPDNADDIDRMRRLVAALDRIARTGVAVVFPVHPRTRRALERLDAPPSLQLLPPVGYRQMLALTQSARIVLTDSGGLQKEAYWLGVPCVTLRAETEWIETVDLGWNALVDGDAEAMQDAVFASPQTSPRPPVYGAGDAAERIARVLLEWSGTRTSGSQLVGGAA